MVTLDPYEVATGWNEYFGNSKSIRDWLANLDPEIANEAIHAITGFPRDATEPFGQAAFGLFQLLGDYHLDSTTEYIAHPQKCTPDIYVFANMRRPEGDLPAMKKLLEGRTDHHDEVISAIESWYKEVNHPKLCPDFIADSALHALRAIYSR